MLQYSGLMLDVQRMVPEHHNKGTTNDHASITREDDSISVWREETGVTSAEAVDEQKLAVYAEGIALNRDEHKNAEK